MRAPSSQFDPDQIYIQKRNPLARDPDLEPAARIELRLIVVRLRAQASCTAASARDGSKRAATPRPAAFRQRHDRIKRAPHGLVSDVEAYPLRSGAQRVIGYLLRGIRVQASQDN